MGKRAVRCLCVCVMTAD